MTLRSNAVDQAFLTNSLSYDLGDEGLIIETNKRKFKIEFDPTKFRPSDVPILLSDISKIKKLGFVVKKNLIDIINDQINYYLDPIHRNNIITDYTKLLLGFASLYNLPEFLLKRFF